MSAPVAVTSRLLFTQFGVSTLRAIDSTGRTTTIPLPFAADLSRPVLDESGNAYLTASVRNLFGSRVTRLYTLTGGASTVRTLPGLAGEMQVAANGVYLETYTYPGAKDNKVDGTTYISVITADTIDTRDPIEGRISGFQVTPDGAIYAAIYGPSLDNSPIAVFDRDGNRTTVVLPGTAPANPAFNNVVGNGPHADEFGYFNYTEAGTNYLAVLDADGSVVRTITLPDGAAGGPVFFGPDGSPYVALAYRGDNLVTLSQQVLSLTNDTYSPIVAVSGPVGVLVPDIQFGPDGTGYLITNPGLDPYAAVQVTEFDASGGTGTTLILRGPVLGKDVRFNYSRLLTFAPDGTAYAVSNDPADAGVYAVTAAGGTKVLDLPYQSGQIAYAVVIGADGTPYLTTAYNNVTAVTPITPPSAL